MRLMTRLTAWLMLALASGAMADVLSPEERLDAIRQALVVRAMEGPTEVRASAFIDGRGVLREASSFVTGMEVRGIRVMAYGRDMENNAKAGISADRARCLRSAPAPHWEETNRFWSDRARAWWSAYSVNALSRPQRVPMTPSI